MPALALLFAVFVVAFEQLVEWRFGVLGVFALALLSIGWHAKNVTCSCVGAVVLTMLLMH
jgi:uncharacterized membrane protein YesL